MLALSLAIDDMDDCHVCALYFCLSTHEQFCVPEADTSILCVRLDATQLSEPSSLFFLPL